MPSDSYHHTRTRPKLTTSARTAAATKDEPKAGTSSSTTTTTTKTKKKGSTTQSIKKEAAGNSEVNVTVNIKNSSDNRGAKRKVLAKKASDDNNQIKKKRDVWKVKRRTPSKTKKEPAAATPDAATAENEENISPRRTRSSQRISPVPSPLTRSAYKRKMNERPSQRIDQWDSSEKDAPIINKNKKMKRDLVKSLFPSSSDSSDGPSCVLEKRLKKRQAKTKRRIKDEKPDDFTPLISSDDDSTTDQTYQPGRDISVARLEGDEKEEESEQSLPEDEEIDLGSNDTWPGEQDTTREVTPKSSTPVPASSSTVSPEKEKHRHPSPSSSDNDDNDDWADRIIRKGLAMERASEILAAKLAEEEEFEAQAAIERASETMAAKIAEEEEVEAAAAIEAAAECEMVQSALLGDDEALNELAVQEEIERDIRTRRAAEAAAATADQEATRRSGKYASGFLKQQEKKAKKSLKFKFKRINKQPPPPPPTADEAQNLVKIKPLFKLMTKDLEVNVKPLSKRTIAEACSGKSLSADAAEADLSPATAAAADDQGQNKRKRDENPNDNGDEKMDIDKADTPPAAAAADTAESPTPPEKKRKQQQAKVEGVSQVDTVKPVANRETDKPPPPAANRDPNAKSTSSATMDSTVDMDTGEGSLAVFAGSSNDDDAAVVEIEQMLANMKK